MDDHPRFWPLFFELYEGLPRQGPGDRASMERALGLLEAVADVHAAQGARPAPSLILDLGCGVGGQTVHLAELTRGRIIAIDSHAESIARLARTLEERGLGGRVEAIVGDMATPPVAPGSVDLVWSEGALYNLGLPRALNLCRELLRPGGFLAFTDAVWLTDAPPPAVKRTFEADYPTMGKVSDDLAAIAESGLELIGHFPLPDEAWWTDFYGPMERRLASMRERYAGDPDALAVLDRLAEEPALHRRHGDTYAYEFFVTRRPLTS